MNLNDYQAAAVKTAIYPDAGSGTAIALTYLGLGLGEAGEIQGKLKKIMRDQYGVLNDDNRLALAKELGDLLWYIATLSSEIGVDLEGVAEINLDKLASRAARGTLGGSGDER